MDLLLYLSAIVLMIWAQTAVQSKYKKYSRVPSDAGLTGAEVARRILNSKGLYDVVVEQNPNGGTLSDHYDPKANTVRLSAAVYNQSSIASVAIAAHEVGHAIQHAEGYNAIAVRNSILPFAVVAQNFGWVAIGIGFFSGYEAFIGIGILMLLVIAAFQLVTLPVELNASSRALALLEGGYLADDEVHDAKLMLRAAAFTYVAALISTLMNILRILVMMNNRRRD